MSFGQWREVTTSVAGDSVEYGCNDVKLISQLFNGLNVPAVKIKSTNGFYFCDSALRLRNPLDTQTLTIRTPAITGAKDLNIPVFSGSSDMMAVLVTPQTLSNKILDNTCDISNALGAGTGNTSPATYDSFPATYNITTGNTLSPNSLWRVDYVGVNPTDGADHGSLGVRVPGSPTGGFARVFYEYAYANANAGGSTSASLALTESPYYTDFDLTLSIRTKAQRRTPTPNAWEAAWIFFRYNEAGNAPGTTNSRFHHYYCAFKSNGHLEVGKKDPSINIDEQFYLETSEPAFSFALGVWNKVRIKCVGNNIVGNHIQVWIDDVLKSDILDDGSLPAEPGNAPNTPSTPSTYLNSGKIGFYNEDAEVEFSPMTITDLSSASTAESFVTMASSGLLSNERILTAGTGISIVDNGPGNTVVINSSSAAALARYVTELDIVNSAIETDILNFSVPGNTLGTNKAIRCTVYADYKNTSGADRSIFVRVKYGATTLFDDTTRVIPQSSIRRPIMIQFTLYAKNSTSSQGVNGFFNVGKALGATAGSGDLDNGDEYTAQFEGVNASEVSTSAKTLSLTIQHFAASANISFRRLYAVLELIA